MKKIIFILLSLSAIGFWLFCSPKNTAPSAEKTIARIMITQVDDFDSVCSKLLKSAEPGNAESKKEEQDIQQLFLQARLSYKRFEWAAEYFEPSAARTVNGPPVQEIEKSGQVFEPSGLQVIETFLFPSFDTSKKKDLQKQVAILHSACTKFKIHFANIDLFDWQVFDAGKLEVYRIIALGLTGFDDPLTENSIAESAASLENLREIFGYYPSRPSEATEIRSLFHAAKNYLLANTDFNSFDRMRFIVDYCNPLTTALSQFQDRLHIRMVQYDRLLNQNAKTLFDLGAFNANAFAPGHTAFATKEKIILGEALFNDPSFSANGRRSCRSCHQPEKAFTDGMAKNTIIDRTELLSRNTPTLLNAALQPALFYDSRVNTLEDQAVTVVQSTNEMHGSFTKSIKRFGEDKNYRKLFQAAYPEAMNYPDTFEVMNALGSYIRSLVSLNSRFDAYLRGTKKSLTSREVNGFNLFMGKAKCGTCHYIPLFNGTFPPRFVKTESEVIGVPAFKESHDIDTDPGRYGIQHVESLKHAFRTPTLRNISQTAPYMHNGIYNTLEVVLDFYDKGGGTGLGLKVENQTLPFDKLGLTQTEKADIVLFMKSLDSKQ